MNKQMRWTSTAPALICFVHVIAAMPSLAAEPNKAPGTKEKWNVAIVVHEDVELLDFAGPGEVFSTAGNRAFTVFTVAETAQPVRSQRFLTITPQYTIANCPKPDIVVIPGGETPRLLRSPAMMKWIRTSADQADIMFSVCTGAFALAEAGLLDGLEATTHYASIAELKRNPRIKVREDRRFVDNGKIITTAGVSAGIDGALHVVARLCGPEAAKRTARYMEYRWQPEAAANQSTEPLPPDVVAAHAWYAGKWPDAEKQYAEIVAQRPTDGVAHYRLGFCQLRQRKHDDAVKSMTRAMECGHRDSETIGQLGLAQMRLKRTDQALKNYEQAIENGERGWGFYYDLAKAYAITGQKVKALTALENAFAAGMVGVEQVLLDVDLHNVRGEDRFRSLIQQNCFGSDATLVTDKEPGEKLVVSGIVRGSDGNPLPDALVYIYQTDNRGYYSVDQTDGGIGPRLFAFLRADGRGRYEIRTIRPAGYPDSDAPQHIHFEVTGVDQSKFVGEFYFADDPRLTDKDRRSPQMGPNITTVTRDKNGAQHCTQDLKPRPR